MKLDLKKNYSEAKWFKMSDGVEFLIRPYPASREKISFAPGGGLTLSGEQQLDKFMYCLVDWKGVEDQDGKAIAISDKVKRLVYDNRLGDIPSFVASKINDMEADRESQAKN